MAILRQVANAGSADGLPSPAAPVTRPPKNLPPPFTQFSNYLQAYPSRPTRFQPTAMLI
jgi:hypothetical protein